MKRLDVPLLNQRELGYPTGCETVSLGMLLNYCQPVDIHELFSKLPRDFNPVKGFRGNPCDDTGFTVFPGVLVELAKQYIDTVYDLSGCELEDIKKSLDSGAPVVVWVSGLGFGVHAVCLSGFNEKGLFYNDPWTGEKDAFIGFESFYDIWNKPVYDETLEIFYQPKKALSYRK